MKRLSVCFPVILFLFVFFAVSAEAQYGPSKRSSTDQRRVWVENVSPGVFYVKTQEPNGGPLICQTWMYCPSCRGTTVCSICHGSRLCTFCYGRGGRLEYGSYYWRTCTVCGGGRGCTLCKGTGQCSCVQYGYPGYAVYGTTTTWPDGRVDRENVNYSDRQSSSGSSSTKKSGPCTRCNGTGANHIAMNLPVVGLHSEVRCINAANTRCSVCGSYSSHYHLKCSYCRDR